MSTSVGASSAIGFRRMFVSIAVSMASLQFPSFALTKQGRPITMSRRCDGHTTRRPDHHDSLRQTRQTSTRANKKPAGMVPRASVPRSSQEFTVPSGHASLRAGTATTTQAVHFTNVCVYMRAVRVAPCKKQVGQARLTSLLGAHDTFILMVGCSMSSPYLNIMCCARYRPARFVS
jgi:hypothetical protein